MIYASVTGLEMYAGELADEVIEQYGDAIEYRLNECEKRLLAYIIPNTPASAGDAEAFEQAVYSQFIFENESRYKDVRELPQGVTRFKLGEFEMEFNGKRTVSAVLTKSTISPAAYGILLRQGLLYRGVM